MTPAEQVIESAKQRHLREMNFAAHRPLPGLRGFKASVIVVDEFANHRPHASACCPHCGSVLTVSEIAERGCNTCCKEHEVRP